MAMTVAWIIKPDGRADLPQQVADVEALYRLLSPASRPVVINVDTVGIGAAMFDRLQHLGLPVRPTNYNDFRSPEAYRGVTGHEHSPITRVVPDEPPREAKDEE